MLIAPATSRAENRRYLSKLCRKSELPIRLLIDGVELKLDSIPWHLYWAPVRDYVEVDRKLVHRLVQLKKAWRGIHRNPTLRNQRMYCWRYFLLLHQALQMALTDPSRGDPVPLLRRIVGFETFLIETRGLSGDAAGAWSNRNPAFLLGRLIPEPVLQTPRHLPLVLPTDALEPYYCYRQLSICSKKNRSLLIFPTSNISRRPASFGPIDRASRLVSSKPDPHTYPRSRILARRTLIPLITAMRSENKLPRQNKFSILDLGAGTGHLVSSVWQELLASKCIRTRAKATLHLVDAAGPCAGRSYGLSRESAGVAYVEWTTADYRELLDDNSWLKNRAPVDWVFLCRVLCNSSTISLEQIPYPSHPGIADKCDLNPLTCLAPRNQPEGLESLEVRTNRKRTARGVYMPQWSLMDYFAAMNVLQRRDINITSPDQFIMPVRRFSPAALITQRGHSILRQIFKIAKAAIIEDPDVSPDDLAEHARQFGLNDVGIIRCSNDRVRTEVGHYIVTSHDLAGHLPGDRIW